MAKRKKLVITREGYLVLAAIGVLILAIIIIAVATKGFGACNGKEKAAVASPSIAPSEYHPAPTFTPKPTPEQAEITEVETPAPETPSPEPEPSVEPEHEPVGCPASIIPSIFTNATANDVIAYYGTEGCAWTVVECNDSTTNPNNYMGVAGYTKTSANTATLTMFVRWQ